MALMITRCPACGTRFKVVPDQLRMSQGWVRCGHCAEIFDAARQMAEAQGGAPAVPAAAAPRAAVPATAPAQRDGREVALPSVDAEAPAPGAASPWQLQSSAQVGEGGVAMPGDVPAGDDALPDAGPTPGLHRASSDAAAGAAGAGADVDPAPPPRLVVSLAGESAPASLRASASGADAIPLPQRPAVQAPPSEPVAPRMPAPVAARSPASAPVDPAHAELSFLRDVVHAPAASAAAGAGRTARLAWSLGAALALLVLLWQLALHERDRLAAAAPGLRPLLQALCAPLDCRVQPLRRIDAIVIDGSSFQALGERSYRLSLTLRNRAPHAVALPAVALSLTDIAEQAVLRRVLQPQDFGRPPEALDAHGEWSASVDLHIAENAGAARVVGYRIDPFYP